jgi:serine/threonine-protein kinase HipA
LSPIYDSLSTVYYPEISRTMAMKLGGEYSSEKVMPRNFEQFAEEAGLAKPMVRRRVMEVIEVMLSALPALELVDGTAEAVSHLIGARCDQAKRLLRG